MNAKHVNLEEFFDSAPEAPKPFTVSGLDATLYSAIMLLDEWGELVKGANDLTPFELGARILARVVVNQDGTPFRDIEAWRKVKAKNHQIWNDVLMSVRRLNGMAKPEEVKEAGKESEAIGGPASNLSSASASVEPAPSSDAP